MKCLKLSTIALVFTSTLTNTLTSAAPLTEENLFRRCYSQFTRKVLPPSNKFLLKIRSGELLAVDACMKIVNQVNFTNGKIAKSEKESLAVLKTFNDFHRTWFSNDKVPTLAGAATPWVYDVTEPALYISRALFSDDTSFSQIVTAKKGLEAVRSKGPKTPAAFKFPEQYTLPFDLPFVEEGALQGIREINAIRDIEADLVDSKNGTSVRISPLKNQGGGILGSPSYLMVNFGIYEPVPVIDGGLKLPRTWARAVFKDLLCKSIPNLNSSDGVKYLQTENLTHATPPFRTGTSCMQCHAGLDGMANVTRNSGIVFRKSNSKAYYFHQWGPDPSFGAEEGWTNSDPDFYKRPPNGKLIFRSYDGSLTDKAVVGFAGLGEALSQTNDLYACAASRYFEFFTGIEVDLNPDASQLPDDMVYRNLVIEFGSRLKASEALPKKGLGLKVLVREIISHPIYRDSANRLYTRKWKAGVK